MAAYTQAEGAHALFNNKNTNRLNGAVNNALAHTKTAAQNQLHSLAANAKRLEDRASLFNNASNDKRHNAQPSPSVRVMSIYSEEPRALAFELPFDY